VRADIKINGDASMIFSPLHIRSIDFSDPADVARHDRMVGLVEQMLVLHKQISQAGTPHEKTALERRIEATDRQIDELVYEPYGLTEEEINQDCGGECREMNNFNENYFYS